MWGNWSILAFYFITGADFLWGEQGLFLAGIADLWAGG